MANQLPCEIKGFGAMDNTVAYEFIWLGAMKSRFSDESKSVGHWLVWSIVSVSVLMN